MQKLRNKAIHFIKTETVLCISFLLAVISSFFVPASSAYLGYIDFRVLGILLGLMIIVKGLSDIGIFDLLCSYLISKTKDTRQLMLVLVLLCFFTSMFITNDVALVTFVPFAIFSMQQAKCEEKTVLTIILQTLAANLGSMLTPSGNPQNLYLFNLSGMSLAEFLLMMLPYSLFSLLLLTVCILFCKKKKISSEKKNIKKLSRSESIRSVIYMLLFIAGILTVSKVIPWQIFIISVIVIMLFCNKNAVIHVDYCLIFTFIFFFILIGNIGNIEPVRNFLTGYVNGNEIFISIIASQIISNVPAALMLSGFTDNYSSLIIGTDLGGLGTLIASMASLISYKAAAEKYPEKRKQYILHFTLANIAFLALLVAFHIIKAMISSSP